MGTLTVRLYLLLMHSLYPQYQQVRPAPESTRISATCPHLYLESLQGPVTFVVAGPLEHQEYLFLQKEKNTNL